MLRLLRSRKSRVLSSPRRRFRRLRAEWLERRELLSGTPPTVVEVQVASSQWSQGFLDYLQTSGMGDDGYAIPLGTSAQTRTLSWTNLDQIKIRFSEDVYVDAADLSLSGVNVTAYAFSDFHYDPQARLATWTLAAPIVRDRLRIDLDTGGQDPVRDLDGNVLDGEWINGISTVSGDGSAGGDFEFNFNVVPGDVDGSAAVMYNDLSYVYQSLGKSVGDPGYIAGRDIDGSGVINTTDRNAVSARLFTSLPSGTPAGTNNDAPTSLGHYSLSISDDAVDHVFSLADWFDDAESGGSGLTYSIVANSNPESFDAATIDAATKSLVLNAADGASDRVELIVRATDAAGLFVDLIIHVDVNYENQPPDLAAEAIPLVGITWLISGTVWDDESDLSGFIVEFSGAFNIRSAVDSDGGFQFAVAVDESSWGPVWVTTYDSNGVAAEPFLFYIGIT